MSKNGDENDLQPIGGKVIPSTRTPRAQIRLSSIKDCRRELAKVYTEARRGSVDPQDATRLTYILVSISNMIKDNELEKRIELLEKARDDHN